MVGYAVLIIQRLQYNINMATGNYFKTKMSMGIAFPLWLLIAGVTTVLVGCENQNFKKAGETIKETTIKTGEVAKDIGRGISEETQYIVEEVRKGANIVVSEVKEGGIFISKKWEFVIDKTKEEFSEAAIAARIKAKYAKSPKVSALHISVTVENNRVILTGKAHCKEEIIEAINLALSVEGVENVTSLLEIRK